MEIEVKNGYLEQNEIDQYVAYLEDKFPNSSLKSLNILLDGEFVDLDYVMQPKKFERIRRITGYLVGTVDRFNDAKKAEESQRVKHDM
ncbi:anaerobic ribonucleoside-triphosphate reductase [Tannockella kyphosi]|uniref:anaerobic ribonucleoside-triphosphate reductase n=1 Tax=Tannockella kyphosi TaxID=2899121 RepID=UPI00201213AB|nr:anaerobic ribonucleoside-triphosphate reductase [Tannockella kyphosi]